MLRLIKYDERKVYQYPNGTIATPERILNDYPAVEYFTYVITTDLNGEIILGFDNLSMLRSIHNIDVNLTEEEAILALEEIINAEPEEEISAEERIAAALEYQNMANMEDVEVIE